MSKYLYCPKCKNYPDKVFQMQNQPYFQFRDWNGEEYELTAEPDGLDYWQDNYYECQECETKLVNKS